MIRLDNFYILDVKIDYSEWLDIFNNWEKKEPFAHPAYCLLFCNEKITAKCAVLKINEGSIIYPFLLRDISKEDYGINLPKLYDIITPYGYGGRYIISCDNLDKITEIFEKNFEVWSNNNNIISEVIKLHLFDNDILKYSGSINSPSQNIVIDLTQTIEDFWINVDQKVRKNVNKAKRNNLSIIIENDGNNLQTFLDIYYETLNRNSAKDYYYFNDSFFNKLTQEMKGSYIFIYVLYGDKIVSAELCLISRDYIYSYLGGTLKEFYELRPNDFLKYEIVTWGIKEMKKSFVLGGGYSINDGIFKYKSSFSPQGIHDFKVGTTIYDRKKYDKIVEIKYQFFKENLNTNWVPIDGFIPLYRS